jgi:lipoprotein NlpI
VWLETVPGALRFSGPACVDRALYSQGKARAYLILGDLRSSLAILRHVGTKDLAIRSQVVSLLDWEGLCLIKEKDFECAVDSFTEAIELDPLQPMLYVHRAVAYTSSGAIEKALRDTEAAIETGSRIVELFVLRGRLFARLGTVFP